MADQGEGDAATLTSTSKRKRNLQLGDPHMGVSQNKGYHFGGPYSKDYSVWGSILGSPYLGKSPYLTPLEALEAERSPPPRLSLPT